MKRSILLCIGWLFSGALFLWGLFGLDMVLNYFDWPETPSAWPVYAFLGIIIIAALTGTWFLARVTRDKVSRGVSIIVSLVIIGFWVYRFPAEPVDQKVEPASGQDAWIDRLAEALARKSASPAWYRGGRILVACLPAGFCFLWWRRHAAHQSAGGKAAPPSG